MKMRVVNNTLPFKQFCQFSICVVSTVLATELWSDEVKVYFSNDSMNGFQLSDAYETHNMGLSMTLKDITYAIDLGIVSPDMHVYKNQYRVANRSYGEIVSVSVGSSNPNNYGMTYSLEMKAIGKFGLDKAQAFAHEVFGLQEIRKINDIVRMPDQNYFGLRFTKNFEEFGLTETVYAKPSGELYLGTDTSSLELKLGSKRQFKSFSVSGSMSVKYVAYDKIVSAPPINAKVRSVIPSITLGYSQQFNDVELQISEIISLPTIESDNRIYAKLFAGIEYKF